jgi:hypothetical protein
MILSNTSAEITVTTSTSEGIGISVNYADLTSTSLTGGSDNTVSVTATSTVVVSSPAASTQRQVKYLSFYNYGSASNNLIIYHDDGISATVVVYRRTLQAGERIEYDGSKWIPFDANGIPIVIGAGATPLLNNRYVISGAQYETFDRNLCNEVNTSLLSTGRLSLQAIYLPAGTVVSSISFWSATTAAGTPTNQLFGLFDSSRNLLRSSVNDTTTAWAANSLKTLALTSTFTTTYSGIHYLGLMVTATTVPTIKGNTAKTNGALNAAAPSMGGTSTTGLTTALPATAAAPATVTTSFWGCVS